MEREGGREGGWVGGWAGGWVGGQGRAGQRGWDGAMPTEYTGVLQAVLPVLVQCLLLLPVSSLL